MKKRYVPKPWVAYTLFYLIEILGLIAMYIRNN